jgi:Domain of unknown function (DUF4351)
VLLDLVMQRLPQYNFSQFRLMYTLRTFEEMKDTVIARDFIDIGRRQGIEQGMTTMLMRQAARRFGALSPAMSAQIHELDYLQLAALSDQLLEFLSLAEMDAWLAAQTTQP